MTPACLRIRRKTETKTKLESTGSLFTNPSSTAIMQNMIFDSVFEVDSVLENKSDFLIVADSILNKRI